MALHYEEYGNNHDPLILFIHGGGVSGWMWNKQIQHFTNYHCVVPDLIDKEQGVNGSNFSIEDSAKGLLTLIEEKANGKQVIVIGFSLGAQILIQMIGLKPELIDYAVINSALIRPAPFTEKLVRPIIKLSFPLIKNRIFSKYQAKKLYVNKENFEKYYQDTANMKFSTLMKILQENMSFRVPEKFYKAQCKILVTVGEKEKSIMRKSAIDLVEINSNCKGVILSKIGHGVSLEKPNFFNQMIEGWVIDGHLPDGKVIE